jgi:gamma-glutamylcyclotransferase (GGCT)/AIG2-like uncharacterized protein YtfP
MKSYGFLFVYGTLRRGGAAEHLLHGADFVGEALIRGSVIQRDGFLGLVAGDTLVMGEVFEVPDPMFEHLDHYEGPGYERRISEVECSGATLSAWVYWLSPPQVLT